MPKLRSTPLAWKNLTHELRRLLLAMAGVGFAVLLMFMQLGFRGALLESTVELPQLFNADLVLTTKSKFTLVVRDMFTRDLIYQAQACPAVEAVYPLYTETQRATWSLPGVTARALPIRTLAFNPRDPVLLIDQVRQHADDLMLPDTVLFDARSKTDYGSPRTGDVAYLADARVRVVGTFKLGTDFATDASAIMSDRNYAHIFAQPGVDGLAQVDLGLIKLKPDANIVAAQRQLTDLLPSHVHVRTKAQFVADEQQFWNSSTPVGYIFGFGTVLGFIVGVIICYQVLYAEVTDHMSEFATLKAMGYRARFFVSIILQESLYISVLGFLPALLASELLYLALGFITGLPLNLTVARGATVLILALAMCAVSGMLTLRKLLSADPAELFR